VLLHVIVVQNARQRGAATAICVDRVASIVVASIGRKVLPAANPETAPSF
jgi:hypothetical protein